MDSKFVVSLSGRDYPLYAGILAEAHERGLQSIETQLIQIPTEENGNTAIMKAVVRMKDGSTFEGYGDASPRNVNPRIATAILRMSETRAKGRALRDAINCGMTMLEELDDTDHAPRVARTTPAPRTRETLERAERPIPVEQPGTAEGFEDTYTEGGKNFRRADLVSAASKLLEEGVKLGLKLEPITPHQATNPQLLAWGRTARTLLPKGEKATEVAA